MFYKYKIKCFPSSLEYIYGYCNQNDNLGILCRDISIKYILDWYKKSDNYNHVIFFSEENVKRLIASQHLFLDCTFAYPMGFYQTLILMYFVPLENKMNPVILSIINNKTTVGY